MLLSRLLAVLSPVAVSDVAEVDVPVIAYDSRAVTPGALFVAMPSVDQHEAQSNPGHVADARRRGAAAVVAQGEIAAADIPIIRVPNARTALADLAATFYGHPSRDLQLFAVTGTDGKTTTTYLLEQVLSASGRCTGLLGTVEAKIGNERRPNLDRMTTPEALDVQRLLRQMCEAGVTHAVLEASSHALALDRLRGCRFAACALTNIAADHLEFHGSWEAYFAAKSRLFTELAPNRPAILNRDDAHFDRLVAAVGGPVVTYGLHPEAQVRATEIQPAPGGGSCVVHYRSQQVPLSVPLPGAFNVANALAVTALALSAGLPLDGVAAAIGGAQAPPGRLQRVSLGQSFEVVVDYAHTMQAFRSVLAALRAQTPGRLIAVFGATGYRDRAKRPELARIARQYADFLIITNEDPYGEVPEAIMAEVAAGLPADEEGSHFLREVDRARAIRLAIERAQPGDAVAILGKGHEQSMVVNGRREPFSDVAAARAALAELA